MITRRDIFKAAAVLPFLRGTAQASAPGFGLARFCLSSALQPPNECVERVKYQYPAELRDLTIVEDLLFRRLIDYTPVAGLPNLGAEGASGLTEPRYMIERHRVPADRLLVHPDDLCAHQRRWGSTANQVLGIEVVAHPSCASFLLPGQAVLLSAPQFLGGIEWGESSVALWLLPTSAVRIYLKEV